MSYESVKKELYSELADLQLDLSQEKYGSKANSSTVITREQILAEETRLAQVRKDAKIIAQEIIKELDKREAEKRVAETVAETIPVETVEVIVVQEPEADYTIPVVSSVCGFVVGILVASLFFVVKIKRIRQNNETW